MANGQRGEVVIEADGQRYTLAVDINSLCELETETGQVYQSVAAKAEAGSFVALRSLIWATTRRHHPALTMADVGRLITAVGVDVIQAKFMEMASSMSPAPEDAKALKLKRPRKAQAANL